MAPMIHNPKTGEMIFNKHIIKLDIRAIANGAPIPFDLPPHDVLDALSKVNRWGGQTRFPFSVLHHSLMCVHFAYTHLGERNPNTLAAILFHDAGEAVIGDIIKPVKAQLPDLEEFESAIVAKVLSNVGVEKPVTCMVNTRGLLKSVDFASAVVESDHIVDCTERLFPEFDRVKYGDINGIHPLSVGEVMYLAEGALQALAIGIEYPHTINHNEALLRLRKVHY